MIGRRVQSKYHGVSGPVVRWEPLGAGMCDVLVHDDISHEDIWLASHNCQPIDGKGGLPDRRAACERARLEAIRSLEGIRDRVFMEKAGALSPAEQRVTEMILKTIRLLEEEK